MKRIIFLTFSALMISAAAIAQGPQTTDVMGGGTPAREDENRMSKQMYDYQEEEKGIQRARSLDLEEREEEKEVIKGKTSKKILD